MGIKQVELCDSILRQNSGGVVAVPGGDDGGVVDSFQVIDVGCFGRLQAGRDWHGFSFFSEGHDLTEVFGGDVVFIEDKHGIAMCADDDVFKAAIAGAGAGGWVGEGERHFLLDEEEDEEKQQEDEGYLPFRVGSLFGVVWEFGAALLASIFAVIG